MIGGFAVKRRKNRNTYAYLNPSVVQDKMSQTVVGANAFCNCFNCSFLKYTVAHADADLSLLLIFNLCRRTLRTGTGIRKQLCLSVGERSTGSEYTEFGLFGTAQNYEAVSYVSVKYRPCRA